MAVWVKLKTSALKLVNQSLKQGVYLQHEATFQLQLQHNTDSHIRLGFAGMSEQQIKLGLEIIFNHKK